MRKLKIRFEKEEDINLFNEKLNTYVGLETKKLYLPANKIKYKKPSRVTPPIIYKYDDYWWGMPSFIQEEITPLLEIEVYIDNEDYISTFSEKLGIDFTEKSTGFWFPAKKSGSYFNVCWKTKTDLQPKYPIYVISKSRPKCITSVVLTIMGVKHKVVIEPQEYDLYAETIGEENLVVLPFSNLGQGSIPARNWVWENSIENGAKWHWIIDDNIYFFLRITNNKKQVVLNGATFRAIEDFVDRYENIPKAGMNYESFVPELKRKYPITWNTRIYSIILLRNDIKHRWRGKFNEDTDLSLRILKDGNCTALFNTFLAEKATTLKMKGGNTDSIYNDGSNRKNFAESLVKQHPDVASIVYKFNRWHHHVDYSVFRNNTPKLKEGIEIVSDNPYDFYLEDFSYEKWNELKKQVYKQEA